MRTLQSNAGYIGLFKVPHPHPYVTLPAPSPPAFSIILRLLQAADEEQPWMARLTLRSPLHLSQLLRMGFDPMSPQQHAAAVSARPGPGAGQVRDALLRLPFLARNAQFIR